MGGERRGSGTTWCSMAPWVSAEPHGLGDIEPPKPGPSLGPPTPVPRTRSRPPRWAAPAAARGLRVHGGRPAPRPRRARPDQVPRIPEGRLHPWFLAARMAPLRVTTSRTVRRSTSARRSSTGGRPRPSRRWWSEPGSSTSTTARATGTRCSTARGGRRWHARDARTGALRHHSIFRPRGTVMPEPISGDPPSWTRRWQTSRASPRCVARPSPQARPRLLRHVSGGAPAVIRRSSVRRGVRRALAGCEAQAQTSRGSAASPASTGSRVVNGDQRRAATEQHQQAISTINEMFDQLDELVAAPDRLTGVAPRGPSDDPIRDAESCSTMRSCSTGRSSELRVAALAASAHRRRRDLASDVGTKAGMLFPRAGRGPEQDRPHR